MYTLSLYFKYYYWHIGYYMQYLIHNNNLFWLLILNIVCITVAFFFFQMIVRLIFFSFFLSFNLQLDNPPIIQRNDDKTRQNWTPVNYFERYIDDSVFKEMAMCTNQCEVLVFFRA